MNVKRSVKRMLILLLFVLLSISFFEYKRLIKKPSNDEKEVLDIDSTLKSQIEISTTFPPLNILNVSSKSVKQIWEEIYAELPNLPLSYGEGKVFETDFCSNYPNIGDIDFNNMYWQRYPTSNGTFYLYGAYLDVRKANNHGPAIRVIGMLDQMEPTMDTFCQIWTNESSVPIITEILEYTFLWRPEWTNTFQSRYQPYMITCLLPDEINSTVPLSVSLVEEECDKPTNNLRVILNLPTDDQPKNPFAVCVKGLSFPTNDLSLRILEWLEILKLLGASKVFLYSLGVHPNIMKVLDYYTQKGFLKVTPHSLPGFLPTDPAMQQLYLKTTVEMEMLIEMIQYHDCIYRNMYLFEYIALIDVDELLVPLTYNNWSDLVNMIKETTNKTWTSMEFRNLFFLDEMQDYHYAQNKSEVEKLLENVPPYLHFMNHVYRHVNFTTYMQRIKCLHNAEQILVIHNHYPIKCLGPKGCEVYFVNENLGRLQHYRSNCEQLYKEDCEIAKNSSILDTAIWKYKDAVVQSSLKVMKEIGFY